MRSHSSSPFRAPSAPSGGQRPEGDAPRDLDAVYRAHGDAIARWAGRLAGPELDLEDIVQDVFVVVQRRLPEFRGDAKLTTWLYEITARVVRDRRRRRRRWRWLVGRGSGAGGEDGAPAGTDPEQVATGEPGPLELLETQEATRTLYRILDEIGEAYREIIIMFELEGLSGQEIAAATGLSLANVWVRLYRGRQKVLQRFLAWEATQPRGTR
jgi:RNA polymerase sigma-70 factor (ECF subfamily)